MNFDPGKMIKRHLSDKVLILKYKKGSRIQEERTYSSADDAPETVRVIGTWLSMYARDKRTNKFDLSHNIIGNGFMCFLPWEDAGAAFDVLEKARQEGDTPESAKISFEWAGPVRVADVREGPDGTIFVDMEAS
jgi:hypothetical protein